LFTVLGFDVGGANTKVACIRADKSRVLSVMVATEYFPVWKKPDTLPEVLLCLQKRLGVEKIDILSVTMTAELSDAYQTKTEGVHHILSCINKAFIKVPTYILNRNSELFTATEAMEHPLEVASANWAATGWLVAQQYQNALVIDVGSTSTSIIPIVNGKPAAKGKTDLDKLICGELVYTGSLRTNIAAIVQSIPVKAGVASVSSEFFALSGDVHLILGNIVVEDYTSETADGRGRSVPEALARLARVVCADIDMLTKHELFEIAQYIYKQQVSQIAAGLSRVYAYTKSLVNNRVPVVITGLGKDFLARGAAEQIGVDEIVDLDLLLPKQAILATPAVGTALMAARKFTGGIIKWEL
jgi:probable H4MPT-linked C1 transfer pathway protein